jgi:hypothetical protein
MRPLFFRLPSSSFPLRRLSIARASSSSSSSSTSDAAASIALAHGIELPGATPFFAGGERGVGLGASSFSALVAARVPLSLCLSCDAGLVSRGACGPPPAQFLPTPRLQRLLPEGGCCDEDEADDGVAWELRLAALQLWACSSSSSSSVDRLPQPQARAKSLWSAWRACGALPPKAPSLLCWSERELAALGDGALAASARAWRAEAKGAFDAFGVGALCDGAAGDGQRFEEYLWAVSAVASRAFALVEEQEDEGEGVGVGVGGGGGSSAAVVGRAAVPLIDLANHGAGSGGANCRVRLVEKNRRQADSGSDAFVELVREKGEGGGGGASTNATSPPRPREKEEQQQEELLISYGPDKPSRVLMERYGFFPPGGAASDRVDWRELAAAGVAGVAAASASPSSSSPVLSREELRRAVLGAGGMVEEEGEEALPPPLSRAALAAAEARVVAAMIDADANPLFDRAHVTRASGSVARLFGWRSAEEFRRARGKEAEGRAKRVGAALAVGAAAARRRADEQAAAAGDDVRCDPGRLQLAAAYRAERARLLRALEAIGGELAAGAG